MTNESYEKAKKLKKAFCFDICPCHSLWKNVSSSDLRISSVTSVEKRESRKHFSASACGLGFKKLFLGSLFSTSVTLEKLKSDEDKFFLRRVMDKYRNKILFFLLGIAYFVRTLEVTVLLEVWVKDKTFEQIISSLKSDKSLQKPPFWKEPEQTIFHWKTCTVEFIHLN